ncbi:tripartite motif-containing protein 2-like [Branchiostoma floridae]|uniref:RING-type E3 ubiquitin transferase n=2 Tax=Branchiostoma floridae TaxID=7739 RepID=A0A9J7HLW0_BRAFL|nr:tripartite motif-containing protein 2-like [Branchiostoma floridae]
MAAALSSLREDICEDLTCSICLELFTRPKMLPCQHTFCQDCIQHLVGGGIFFLCPYCRQLTRIPAQGVPGLPDNRMASSLCRKLKRQLGEIRPGHSGSILAGTSRNVAALDAGQRHGNQQQTEPSRIMIGGEGSRKGEFRCAVGVAVSDEGEIFVADHRNQRIQVFTLRGAFVRQFPTVVPDEETMMNPDDVALDGEGNLWVVGKQFVVEKPDSTGFAVRYTKQGIVQEKFDLLGIRWYRGVAVDTRRNHILITQTVGDWDNQDKLCGEVHVFRADGTLVGTVGAHNSWWGYLFRRQRLKYPAFLTVDGDGNVFVTDCENHCVFVYNEDGQFLFQFGGEGSGDGQLNDPQGICTDSAGNIVVADMGNGRVEMFDKTGKFLRHVATDAQRPLAVAMATQGQLVVTDMHHDIVTIFGNY